MWIATVSAGDRLDAMLADSDFSALAAMDGDAAPIVFARGVAFANLGRLSEARAAFAQLSAHAIFSAAAAVEAGFLGLNDVNGPHAVAAQMQELIAKLTPATTLFARANHLLGVATFRQMHIGEALDALARAQECYSHVGCEFGMAQVLDTLGMVNQSMGSESAALVSFAHSLALKNKLGDSAGTAITLGNLGRYCAMLGRAEEARALLSLDLSLAETIGDVRGQARVLTDLAEIARDGGDLVMSQEKLDRALVLSKAASLQQIEFEVHLGQALTSHAAGNSTQAQAALEMAQQTVGPSSSPFDVLLLDWVKARLLAKSDPPAAITLLSGAVLGFRDADIPSFEIDARLQLAELFLSDGKRSQAERETLLALKRSRERGLARYRVRIGELMERLSLSEGIAEESGKPIDDKPSATVDGYLVRQRLGGGTFATVFRAFDVERAREVALKVLDLESRYGRAERDRLLDSARLDLEAANRARHPGLVKVFAMGRDARGNIYLSEELIAGKDLRENLDGRAAKDPKTVCSTLGDVAEALAALHDCGVVHRDLKPENIMMRPDGSPVIVDFGIAHIAGLGEASGAVSRGSPEYFSPEQARGEPSVPSDDMYSFGVILWEWLKGTRPLGPHHKSTFFANRSVPKDADELASALLDTKPTNRPTAAQAAQLLRSFAA